MKLHVSCPSVEIGAFFVAKQLQTLDLIKPVIILNYQSYNHVLYIEKAIYEIRNSQSGDVILEINHH